MNYKFEFFIKNLFCVFILLFTLSGSALAGDADSTKVKKLKIYPFPAIGYAPETRWYIGAVALFNFRTSDDTTIKPASFQTEFNITQNKQWSITAGFEIRLKKDNYLLVGDNGYYDFPEYYWPTGITTDDDQKFNYESKRLELDNTFYRKIKRGLYVGLRYRFHQMNIDSSDIHLFPYGTKSNQLASGIGGSILIDTRDELFYPTKGWLASFSVLFFNESFGGNYTFTKVDLDVRKYFQVHKTGILGWQFVSVNTVNTSPTRMVPALGGENIMRGYYYGRFRDEQMVSTQIEYRQEIYKRFGAAVFAGTGTVYSKNNESNEPFELKPNYGIGLRYTIDKKDHVNLRLDYGFGKDISGFYISFGEAF